MKKEEQPEVEEKAGFSFWRLMAWAVAILIIYVLSSGPVLVIADKSQWWKTHPKAAACVEFIYEPLGWAYNNTFLRKPLEDYIGWWEKRIPEKKPAEAK